MAAGKTSLPKHPNASYAWSMRQGVGENEGDLEFYYGPNVKLVITSDQAGSITTEEIYDARGGYDTLSERLTAIYESITRGSSLVSTGVNTPPGLISGVGIVATAKDLSSEAVYTVDASTSTFYGDTTGQATGDWLSYDLGERRAISQIVIRQLHGDDYAPAWSIHASNTGQFSGEQVLVGSGSQAGAGSYTHSFDPPELYRYWRMTITTPRGGYHWKVHEVEFTAAEEITIAGLRYGQRVISYTSENVEVENKRIEQLSETVVILSEGGIDHLKVYDADGSTLRLTADVSGYTSGDVYTYFD